MSNDTNIKPENVVVTSFTDAQKAAVIRLQQFENEYYSRIARSDVHGSLAAVPEDGKLSYGIVKKAKEILTEEGLYHGDVTEGTFDIGLVDALEKYSAKKQMADIKANENNPHAPFPKPAFDADSVNDLRSLAGLHFQERSETWDSLMGMWNGFADNATSGITGGGVSKDSIDKARAGDTAFDQGHTLGEGAGLVVSGIALGGTRFVEGAVVGTAEKLGGKQLAGNLIGKTGLTVSLPEWADKTLKVFGKIKNGVGGYLTDIADDAVAAQKKAAGTLKQAEEAAKAALEKIPTRGSSATKAAAQKALEDQQTVVKEAKEALEAAAKGTKGGTALKTVGFGLRGWGAERMARGGFEMHDGLNLPENTSNVLDQRAAEAEYFKCLTAHPGMSALCALPEGETYRPVATPSLTSSGVTPPVPAKK